MTNPVSLEDEAAFWASHPLLVEIERFSHARLVSRWAVLGWLLVRCLASVPSRVTLPPMVGGQASLNFFIALVAESGGGKSAAKQASIDCLAFADEAQIHGIGTGEGLTQTYLQMGDDGHGNKKLTRNDVEGAIFTADEVGMLEVLGQRSGNSLHIVLKTAWSGDLLSQVNATPERNRRLEAGTYRMGMVVGVQPLRSAALFDDAGGGTPQRFLWFPATDPTLTKPNTQEKDWAYQRAKAKPIWTVNKGLLGGSQGRDIKVCPEAWRLVEETRVLQGRGLTAALDGHALLSRLKLATALALLCDRTPEVTETWWERSGLVMRVSDRTRAIAQAGAFQNLMDIGSMEGISAGARIESANDIALRQQIERVKGLIRKGLAKGPQTVGDLRRAMNSRDRNEYPGQRDGEHDSPFSDALQDMIVAGQVKETFVERDGKEPLPAVALAP